MSFWLRHLPASLKRKFENRPNLHRIVSNTVWLFLDRILRMGAGLIVTIWMARHLGPQQFGLLNYAIAFTALFSAVAGLGLNSIVVRDLVNTPENLNTTLGTAFILQVIGGALALSIALFAIGYMRPNQTTLKLMVGILGFVMLFKATEVVKYWFESQVQSKYTVLVENSVFLIFAILKILLILLHAKLMAFIWILLLEGFATAIGLLLIYKLRGDSFKNWQFRLTKARSLLTESWPLILSSLAVMLYMRIDQIMLGEMLNDEAVGVFSAAVRVSEVWYFIPVAIVSSLFPSIIEAKKHSDTLYYQRLQKLYDMLVIMAVSIALPMTFLSTWLVTLLFGEAYKSAGLILSIHIWASVFVFLGVASNKWFLIENMQTSIFYRSLLGMLINIITNLLLIPIYGAIGAAISTLLTQILATYIFDLFRKQSRPSFWLKTASLMPLSVFRKRAKNIINSDI